MANTGVTIANSTLFSLLLITTGAFQLVKTQATELTQPNATNVIEVLLPNRTIDQLNLAVSSIEGSFCDTSANCTGLYQICVNGLCRCKPNYAEQNGQCSKEDCTNRKQMCSQQDPNRVCEAFQLTPFSYSHCVCRENYIEDPLTNVCRPKCVSDPKYHMCEQLDPNSLCNVYRCQCKANFRRNVITGLCEPFKCKTDSDCWTEADYYRICSINGTCACTYEIDPITQRCVINLTSLFKLRYYYSWRTERILLATIFVTPIVFYYCFLQNFRKAKSTIVSFRAPRPGEQFYSHQTAISIQSPKFMSSGLEGNETTVVKKVDVSLTRTDPTDSCKNIKYERFE